jgi:tRNA-intron endonuclease
MNPNQPLLDRMNDMENPEKPVEVFKAFLKNMKVYMPLSSSLRELRERGFGNLRKGKVVLSSFEAFYLLEKERIKVSDARTKIVVELRDLVDKLSAGKAEIWIKYLIYRDLRDRGYIVRESQDADFEIHGKGATRRLISIVYEGREASLEKLGKYLKVATREKKELILAVIDRRTDIVYYSLNSLKI